MNIIRYRILLTAGIIAILSGIIDILMNALDIKWFFLSLGSPFAYGTGILMIGLSLNFVFEYLNVLTRSNETNKKLTELNRQMMDDVRTAQSLQISLLPLDKQKFIQNFIDMEISYMPMQSVGGDYYDFYKLDDNNILLFLGDASGHGVYAAMIWAILKVEVEELIENKYFDNLSQAFTLLNKRITRILENTYSYATLFACSINLESRVINFISAGHTDQLYYSKQEKTVKRVRNKNPIIGTFKNAKFTADSINCRSGDALLLFSDGIVEGINPEGKQLGKERLEKIFLDVTKESGTASRMIGDILMKLEDFFEGTLQKDDRTIMVIKL
jgi:sigma-B regulation protein RsbU (phosphoserine phosphatase)